MRPLTSTEIEVLQLTAQGLSAKQIAHQKNRSKGTIETHRLNIYRKLQVKNACEAVNVAKEKGLI